MKRSTQLVLGVGILFVVYVLGYAWLRSARSMPRTSGGKNVIVLRVWDLPFSDWWRTVYKPVAQLESERIGMPIRVTDFNPDKRGAQNLLDGWGWDSKGILEFYTPTEAE